MLSYSYYFVFIWLQFPLEKNVLNSTGFFEMKRRRTRAGSEAGSPQQEKKLAIAKASTVSTIKGEATVEVHATDDNMEEVTAERRDVLNDCASFERTCEEIRKLIGGIQQLKQEGHEHTVC